MTGSLCRWEILKYCSFGSVAPLQNKMEEESGHIEEEEGYVENDDLSAIQQHKYVSLAHLTSLTRGVQSSFYPKV